MNSLGIEVITKVKEAIRAKLKEMNANSSDEIIDYIMLLVTTKKTSSELAKSIDFVMENNTAVFVKWLTTIIKKLQQVTVSTREKKESDNLQVPKETIETNENGQSDSILNSKTTDIKLVSANENKEEPFLDLSTDDANLQLFKREKKQDLPELNASKTAKSNVDKVPLSSDKLNSTKEKISFLPKETIKTRNIIQINNNNTPVKKDSKVTINSIVSKKQNSDIKIGCQSKRPRISIYSDDENEESVKLNRLITLEVANNKSQTKTELHMKNNQKSQVIVVERQESKKDKLDTKKKLYMHDLIAQRVDHQRGALALDTAFKYIQQQIGASDTEISIVKKWRDYAVQQLRSSKKA